MNLKGIGTGDAYNRTITSRTYLHGRFDAFIRLVGNKSRFVDWNLPWSFSEFPLRFPRLNSLRVGEIEGKNGEDEETRRREKRDREFNKS